MNHKKFSLFSFFILHVFLGIAQQKKINVAKPALPANDSLVIPITNADLGTFPYFKTLPNFYAPDSATLESNRTYFFNGKNFFTVDGKVSHQKLNIQNSNQAIVSEFGCIQAFDKVVATLGGIKVYAGKFPEEKLKAFTGGADMVELGGKSNVVESGYYGIVEYVIKTPEKEVWIQLEPYSLGSKFYDLLVVEKQTPLLQLNTNKKNQILEDLEKDKKAIIHLEFEPDSESLLTRSRAELLSLVGIFQVHPAWKIKLECHEAPVGKSDYILQLTNKRAESIKKELMGLGVKNVVEATGMGDQHPLVSNETEQGRLTNTRVEIILQ